jgi:hypothetical protein
VIPGFCFSNTDWVSGIICPVISGFDTTATVTVPLLLLPPLAAALLLVEPPPLEQAAASVARATAHPAAASFLLEPLKKENLGELINEPPRR